MVNPRKKTGVPHHGSFRLLLALATLLICFSPDRLTCPLNSAVVLASYAVQCKSPREHFTDGQTVLTHVLRKSQAFLLDQVASPLPRNAVGQASLRLSGYSHFHPDWHTPPAQGCWLGKVWMSPYNRSHCIMQTLAYMLDLITNPSGPDISTHHLLEAWRPGPTVKEFAGGPSCYFRRILGIYKMGHLWVCSSSVQKKYIVSHRWHFRFSSTQYLKR